MSNGDGTRLQNLWLTEGQKVGHSYIMAGSHCCSKVGCLLFCFLHKLFYIPGNHWGGPGCGRCMVFHTTDFGSFGNNIHFSQKVNHTLQCVCEYKQSTDKPLVAVERISAQG